MFNLLKKTAKKSLGKICQKNGSRADNSGTAASTTNDATIAADPVQSGLKEKAIPYRQYAEPIYQPLEFDILLGRGKTSFNNKGNRSFRVFVGLHLRSYMEANSRLEKTKVVNFVCQEIIDSGGRFLKNKDNDPDVWIQVSQKVAREKVGHALRDAVTMRLKLINKQENTNNRRRRASDIDMETQRSASITEIERQQLVSPRPNLDRNTRSCGDLPLTRKPSDKRLLPEMSRIEDYRLYQPVRLQAPVGRQSCRGNDDVTTNSVSTGETCKQSNLLEHAAPLSLPAIPSDSSKNKTILVAEGSGELSIMSEVSKAWECTKTVHSLDFSVDSGIFDDSGHNDKLPSSLAIIINMALKDLNFNDQQQQSGDTNQSTGRRTGIPDVVPLGVVDRRKSSSDEVSDEFSVMSIDTTSRISRKAAPDLLGEFSVTSGWDDDDNDESMESNKKGRAAVIEDGSSAALRLHYPNGDEECDVLFQNQELDLCHRTLFLDRSDSKKSMNSPMNSSHDWSSRELDVSAEDLGIEMSEEPALTVPTIRFRFSEVDQQNNEVESSQELSVASKGSTLSAISTEC